VPLRYVVRPAAKLMSLISLPSSSIKSAFEEHAVLQSTQIPCTATFLNR
jgi:hypothetical protein